jgi:hypothetical protein
MRTDGRYVGLAPEALPHFVLPRHPVTPVSRDHSARMIRASLDVMYCYPQSENLEPPRSPSPPRGCPAGYPERHDVDGSEAQHRPDRHHTPKCAGDSNLKSAQSSLGSPGGVLAVRGFSWIGANRDPKEPTNRQTATSGRQGRRGLDAQLKPKDPSWCGGDRACRHVLNSNNLGALAVQKFRIGSNRWPIAPIDSRWAARGSAPPGDWGPVRSAERGSARSEG